jgi:redox-sensitive bicupin YhaK (pirin superfamily)
MIMLRPAGERGRTRFDWLDSRHTFSFGDYRDPRQTGFRTLRVINDDVVEPGRGFGAHSHRDMEILTYVLEGAIEHKDSTGTSSVIVPGEVQRMRAGTGITHSEFNHSKIDPVHFLQIWILPDEQGLPPGYEQKEFPEEDRRGRLALLASRDGRDGSLTIHQDAAVYGALLAPGREVTHRPARGRRAWVHVARGAVTLGGRTLAAGDGAAVEDEAAIVIAGAAPGAGAPRSRSGEDADVLIFDLA